MGTYLFTYSWSRVLEKLTSSQLVQKLPTLYGTWRFITAFTIACHLSLSWARSIQSIPHIPLLEEPSIYYSPIYAWVFQVVSFPQVSLPKPCVHLFSPTYVLHARPSHSSRFYHPNNIGWGVQIIKLLFM